jgi:hypothetical protein
MSTGAVSLHGVIGRSVVGEYEMETKAFVGRDLKYHNKGRTPEVDRDKPCVSYTALLRGT